MKEVVAVITALAIALALIVGLAYCQNQKQNDRYNNGICSICGTPFHFVNVTYEIYQGHKYIYACDNEHIIICSEEQHVH